MSRTSSPNSIDQTMRRVATCVGVSLLTLGISACGRAAGSTRATRSNPRSAAPLVAANYQGPLQNFQLPDPGNASRVAADIATVMENNLSATYPPAAGYFVFASCTQQGLPHEFQCPWKVQNANQVEQLGGYAAPILATGIIYVYANDSGIYDVEVPGGGDASPVGATLPERKIIPLPSTATATTSSTEAAPPSDSTQPSTSTQRTPPEESGTSTTASTTSCGTISAPANAPAPTNTRPGYRGARQTVHVPAGGPSCSKALKVISDFLAGKGSYHQGPDLASSYTTVDGWSCQFQMGSSGCTRGREYIAGRFEG